MLTEPSESDLLRQAAAGDRASLSQLLLLHYDELYRYISQRISDELRTILLPEDVLQETFYRAAGAIQAFEHRGNGSFCAWLKTISGNLVKDAQKRRTRERRSPQNAGRRSSHAEQSSFLGILQSLTRDTVSPSGLVRRSDNAARLRSALAGLPPDQREVIQRHYLRDESFEQIGRAMDRSKDAIRGICYRARQNLRLILGHSSQYFSR